MESERRCYVGSSIAPMPDAVNLIVHQVFFAEKSIHWLLFLIVSVNNNADAISNLLEAEKRFPFSDLKKVTTPDAECKDDSEAEDNSDDDEGAGGGDDSDNDAEDSSGDEDNDNEQGDADSVSDENDEEDDDDSDEDDDDDDDDDDEDDEDEDEDEDNQPPFMKKK